MKISVALCTYNGEQFIKEQIDSILNQTLSVHEIIICDDRSSDNTIEILEQYSVLNPEIFKIFINETNLRSVKNFEKAITLCTGDVIFLSDQDDIWSLNKVEDYINYFDKNSKIDVLASNGYCINEKSEVEEKYAIWDVPQFLSEKKVVFKYYELITEVGNIATGASMAFRKKILPEIIPFPIVKDFHHDEWIAIISSNKGAFELLNEKYFYYRIHNNQQVGGVFYNKTKKNKIMLTEVFNINEEKASLSSFKKRLKKLSTAYYRNQNIIKNNTAYNDLFKENKIQIELLFNKINKLMSKKYPFSSLVLKFTDKISNKRQLENK
ncbi:MAG: glycosyltransferase [Flavobacterium sp.]|uniref:glycosyltransferase n=1 Tax=Flavobacterium sp. TaxID=239 RepID=UPI003265AE84